MLSGVEAQPKDLAKNGTSPPEELPQHLYKSKKMKIKTLTINTLKIIFYF